jgi:hypothetical protein
VAGNLIVPQPQLSVAGRPLSSTTRIACMGGYGVALATALEGRGIELQSSYVGHPGVDTHVTHLLLAPGVHDIESQDVSHMQLPVLYARRRCLYDHLQRLQDFADELGIGPLQADLLDETLLALEG